MPYRFERLDTATMPDQLMVVLRDMERRQFDITQYVAIQCYRESIGPPMSRGKAAPWYSDFNPDQLYLSFEGFQPAKVESVISNFSSEFGEGWVVYFRHPNSEGVAEASFYERQTYEPTRILSLSVFKRVQAGGGATRPFVRPSQPDNLPTPSDNLLTPPGGSPSPQAGRDAPSRPSPVRPARRQLRNPAVRALLQDRISLLPAIDERVVMDGDGVFHTLQGAVRVAEVVRVVDNPPAGYIQVIIRLPGRGQEDLILDHRDISRLERQLTSREVAWYS